MKESKNLKTRLGICLLCILFITIMVNSCNTAEKKDTPARSKEKQKNTVDKIIKNNSGEVLDTPEDDGAIPPATDPLGAVQLFYQGFNEHNTDYMDAAALDGTEAGMKAVLGNDIAEYWENHDADQGSYFNVGIFTSYEITAEVQKPVADLASLQDSLASDYGFQGTIEEAYEIDFNRIIHGTEDTVTKKNNYALVVKTDGYWYLVKRELS